MAVSDDVATSELRSVRTPRPRRRQPPGASGTSGTTHASPGRPGRRPTPPPSRSAWTITLVPLALLGPARDGLVRRRRRPHRHRCAGSCTSTGCTSPATRRCAPWRWPASGARCSSWAWWRGSGRACCTSASAAVTSTARSPWASPATLAFLLVGRSTYRAWLTDCSAQRPLHPRRPRRRHQRRSRRTGRPLRRSQRARLPGRRRARRPRRGHRPRDRQPLVRRARPTPPEPGRPGSSTGVVVAIGDPRRHHVLNDLVRTLQQRRRPHAHLVGPASHRLSPPAGAAARPRAAVLRRGDGPCAARQLAIKRAHRHHGVGSGAAVRRPRDAGARARRQADDRGPVLFKQTRVGHRRQAVQVLQVPHDGRRRRGQAGRAAEDANERNGPLFKMDSDPRVTRVGKLPARRPASTSCPQLFNVLQPAT